MSITRNIVSGHAKGHLRDAFTEAVEDLSPNPDEVEVQSLREAAGHLWNCTDVLPGNICDDLDIDRGSTYAQAARLVVHRW